ncbi:MAG: ATP-dependent zinc protease [Gammaproteobacteria bacterium]
MLCFSMTISASGQGEAEQIVARDDDRLVTISTAAKSDPPAVFGWLEKIILSPELRWKLDAKLDTGADTSSLDAIKIRRVRVKGKRYVRFSVRNPETGETVSLRRPYVRTVRIRQHSGDHQKRYVVLMEVCLGDAERMIEVTLTNREDFDYPVLLGRSALAGLAVVNSSSTYTSEPGCRNTFGPTIETVEENRPVAPENAESASDSFAQ